jgi:hypothetical protein
MKIFLSYATEDNAAAESIAFSLRGRSHNVFLDRDELPAGASYDQQIERAVNNSDIFVFLISPDSVAEGRYTLTELTFARHKWPDPNGHILPVIARKTPFEKIPRYLKAVTVLDPVGNIVAETSSAVDKMQHGVPPRLIKPDMPEFLVRYRGVLALGAIGGVVILVLALFAFNHPGGSITTQGDQSPVLQNTQGNVDIKFGSPAQPASSRPEK